MLREVIPVLSAGRGDGFNNLCAMQSISWQRGDVEITDFPECSSKHLAVLVQYLNDTLADEMTMLLSPKDAMAVLDLGWKTVGTGNAGQRVAHLWFAELLDNPGWGLARFLEGPDRELCGAVADAHRSAADGRDVDWLGLGVSRSMARAKREPLQSLSMYVAYYLSCAVPHVQSVVRTACHANYYYGTDKGDWVSWAGAAIEGWRSLQLNTTVELERV
jgi:hypothetical protein